MRPLDLLIIHALKKQGILSYNLMKQRKQYIYTDDLYLIIRIASCDHRVIKTLTINTSNINRCCKHIMINIYIGNIIVVRLHCDGLTKHYQDFISRICDGCFAYTQNGLKSFLPMLPGHNMYNDTVKRKAQLANFCVFLPVLITNYRYIYNIMKHPSLWKDIFDAFVELIDFCPDNMDLEYIGLIITFINATMIRWRYEHIHYLQEIELFEKFWKGWFSLSQF